MDINNMQYIPINYLIKVQKILLKRGYNYSKEYISMVKNGTRNNTEIKLAIAEIIDEERLKQEKIKTILRE